MININLKPCCDECVNADINCRSTRMCCDGHTECQTTDVSCEHSEVCGEFNKEETIDRKRTESASLDK